MTADLTRVTSCAAAAEYLAVISVARPDGSVHASLVKAGVLDDPGGNEPSIGVVVAGDALKLNLLRRAGRATVLFQDGWRWVSVEGPVRLLGPDDPPPRGDPDVPGVIRAVYRAAGGTHDDWDAFDRVMAEDRRCAVFIHAAKVRGNA